MMRMSDADELERIKKRKLEAMMREATEREETTVISSPIVITDANFNEMIKKYPLIVIDCWAAWCGPCRMISPTIDALAKDYAGRIVFGKLNVDENQVTARNYRIMSIPALLIFKNGVLVDQVIGALPREIIEQKIVKYL
ncbi:MAG: thioredoxin [Candidatus Syntrophoarchaeum caldarius]|uniref:Thioredoxin n=1 Tax=Candidatus Syntropharchaeum caldarium TaxID=1838285 RepID=A0A1F2PBT3_9EURY|nr:MAG: thioredoxin [Candidatus Syntrophoarchaeum caldarius]